MPAFNPLPYQNTFRTSEQMHHLNFLFLQNQRDLKTELIVFHSQNQQVSEDDFVTF